MYTIWSSYRNAIINMNCGSVIDYIYIYIDDHYCVIYSGNEMWYTDATYLVDILYKSLEIQSVENVWFIKFVRLKIKLLQRVRLDPDLFE